MNYFLVAVFCWCVLPASGNADGVKTDPRASSRARYAGRSPAPLGIVEPVTISRAVAWKDGGTVGIELTDARDKKHAFCLYSPGGAGLPERDAKPRIILNLFIGAVHPGHQWAKMVEVRGPEESALYGVLLRAIDRHKEKDAILAKDIDGDHWRARNLWGTDLFTAHEFFHRLEGHFLKE